jgi:hypothetical protein
MICQIRAMLKSEVHGLGPTGLDIFFRRVQHHWPSVYPFIDQRTADALGTFGLPGSKAEMKKLIDREVCGKGKEQKRKAFVIVLERVLGAVLEKREEELEAAV